MFKAASEISSHKKLPTIHFIGCKIVHVENLAGYIEWLDSIS